MKRLFSFLALSALVLSGCNKVAEDGISGIDEGKPIRLVVDVNGSVGTRATGITSNSADSEAKVNTLQVFVFNGNGLDGYGSSSNSLSATVSCTTGSRDIYAVVNAADLSAVTTKTALLATVSNLANSTTNFQMIGSKTETLKYDGSVSISVDRLAARVVIKGIKNAMENAAQAADFRLDAVYLTNAVGDANFGLSGTYVPTVWYNRRGYESANNLGSMTYDAVNATVASGATNSTAHYFYTYPNGFDQVVGIPGGGSAFTARGAMLVVKATIAGTTYDFPIELPHLENNKSYEIELLTITRSGNVDDGDHDPDDPDDIDEEKPINSFDQSFTITVNNWTTVLVGGTGNITI